MITRSTSKRFFYDAATGGSTQAGVQVPPVCLNARAHISERRVVDGFLEYRVVANIEDNCPSDWVTLQRIYSARRLDLVELFEMAKRELEGDPYIEYKSQEDATNKLVFSRKRTDVIEFSFHQINLVVGLMEEGQYDSALDMIDDFISERHCPPRTITQHIIADILLCPPQERDSGLQHEYLAMKAFRLLCRVFRFHRPSSSPIAWRPISSRPTLSLSSSQSSRTIDTDEENTAKELDDERIIDAALVGATEPNGTKGFCARLALRFICMVLWDDFIHSTDAICISSFASILSHIAGDDFMLLNKRFLDLLFAAFEGSVSDMKALVAIQQMMFMYTKLSLASFFPRCDIVEDMHQRMRDMSTATRNLFFETTVSHVELMRILELWFKSRCQLPPNAKQAERGMLVRATMSLEKFVRVYSQMIPLGNDDPPSPPASSKSLSSSSTSTIAATAATSSLSKSASSITPSSSSMRTPQRKTLSSSSLLMTPRTEMSTSLASLRLFSPSTPSASSDAHYGNSSSSSPMLLSGLGASKVAWPVASAQPAASDEEMFPVHLTQLLSSYLRCAIIDLGQQKQFFAEPQPSKIVVEIYGDDMQSSTLSSLSSSHSSPEVAPLKGDQCHNVFAERVVPELRSMSIRGMSFLDRMGGNGFDNMSMSDKSFLPLQTLSSMLY